VPAVEVVFYREGDTVFLREWLKTLPLKAQMKCLAYIGRLEDAGYELRRPIADFLRDGIYELRPAFQGVNYRVLYFFAGQSIVVVSHGIVKGSAVPSADIDRALERKRRFEAAPEAHAYRGT
jgi:hypothetical protein